MACNPRDAGVAVGVEDDDQAYGDGDGYEAVHEGADGASSLPAKREQEDSRCAEATSRFQDSNYQGCDPHRRRPYHRGTPLSGFPIQNYRLLKHQHISNH